MSRVRSREVSMQQPDAPTPVERSYLEVISYLAARREPVLAAQLARWMHVRPPDRNACGTALNREGADCARCGRRNQLDDGWRDDCQ